MIVNKKEFKKQPEIATLPKWEQDIYYIINVGHYENYDEAIDYVTKCLKSSEELIKIAAIQALQILVHRFYNIKEDIVLPLLFENLKSTNKKIQTETMTSLGAISHLVPRLKQKIYLTCFENGVDFFTYEKLKVFIDKNLISSLNSEEEKKEFILSFCQNSQNYQESLEVCLYFLEKNESEDINIAAFQGLTYLVFRFEKIDFDKIFPYIRKFLDSDSCEYTYAESILADIAITIPALKQKAIFFLEEIESGYLELYNLNNTQ